MAWAQIQDRRRGIQQRMHVEYDSENAAWLRQQPGKSEKRNHTQQNSGDQEQPTWAIEQHESQVPPAVATTAEDGADGRGPMPDSTSSAPQRRACPSSVALMTISEAILHACRPHVHSPKRID